MARIYDNFQSPGRYSSDSSQLTYWVLYSGETCHITPQVSGFIPGSLEDIDKHIEVADVHNIT